MDSSPLKATELSSPTPGTAIVKARAIKLPPKLPRGTSYSVPFYLLTPGKALATTIELGSTLALILVYFVLPFEIAFVDAPSLPDPSNALYIFNRLIDLAFTLDILANFCTAYEIDAPDESGGDDDDDDSILKRRIAYETRLSKIWMRYLKGWLVMDLASMGPSVIDIQLAFTSVDGDVLDAGLNASLASNATKVAGGSGDLAMLKMTRTLKLFKMLKMARMLKMLKMLRLAKMVKFMTQDGVVKRTIDTLAVEFAQHARKVRVLRLLMMIFLITHIMACTLGIAATFGEERLDSWWGTHGYCWPDDLYKIGPAEPEIARCIPAARQYLVCFHICLGFILKMPWGPFITKGPGVPFHYNGDSNSMFQVHEHLVFMVVSYFGALLSMYTTGAFVSVAAAKDGKTMQEEVISFSNQYKVPSSSRRRMLRYFQDLSNMSGTVPKGDLFTKLSPSLARELILDIHSSWLDKLPFKPFLEADIRGTKRPRSALRTSQVLCSQIALSMTSALYVQDERPVPGRLYVVLKGRAEQAGCRQLKVYDNWGCFDLINEVKPNTRGTVKAKAALQVVYLTQDNSRAILKKHPEASASFRRMRTWALLWRLRRGIRRAAAMEMGTLGLHTPPGTRRVRNVMGGGAPRENTGDRSFKMGLSEPSSNSSTQRPMQAHRDPSSPTFLANQSGARVELRMAAVEESMNTLHKALTPLIEHFTKSTDHQNSSFFRSNPLSA